MRVHNKYLALFASPPTATSAPAGPAIYSETSPDFGPDRPGDRLLAGAAPSPADMAATMGMKSLTLTCRFEDPAFFPGRQRRIWQRDIRDDRVCSRWHAFSRGMRPNYGKAPSYEVILESC
jgi:hypothetical protein